MPDSVCVAALNVTPAGSAPLSVYVGAGNPVAVTMKLPELPTRKDAAGALVIAGASLTVSVRFCDAEPTAFVAVNVIEYWRPVPAAGVPEITPVAGLKPSPAGKLPVIDSDGAGLPVAVTWNVPNEPTLNAA